MTEKHRKNPVVIVAKTVANNEDGRQNMTTTTTTTTTNTRRFPPESVESVDTDAWTSNVSNKCRQRVVRKGARNTGKKVEIHMTQHADGSTRCCNQNTVLKHKHTHIHKAHNTHGSARGVKDLRPVRSSEKRDMNIFFGFENCTKQNNNKKDRHMPRSQGPAKSLPSPIAMSPSFSCFSGVLGDEGSKKRNWNRSRTQLEQSMNRQETNKQKTNNETDNTELGVEGGQVLRQSGHGDLENSRWNARRRKRINQGGR